MGLVHTIPETDVTVPAFLDGAPNGRLPEAWLRSPEVSTSLHRKLFVPVSYATQAMHLAAAGDEVLLRTTGRYRTYDQQVALFRSRFVNEDTGSGVVRRWDGKLWWKLPGVALAATPGTSNHGLGLADDIAEQDDADPELESIDDVTLQWLADHAHEFGFTLDIHSERWHWHWHNHNALTQRTVDVLRDSRIAIQDLAPFGFTQPDPTGTPPPPPPPEEDDMLFLARSKANPNLWLRGDGVISSRIRSAQLDEVLDLLVDPDIGPVYHNPVAAGLPIITAIDQVPRLTDEELVAHLGNEVAESIP